MTIDRIDLDTGAIHPQLFVTTLLQHGLDATSHALAAAHPEIRDDDDLGGLDEDSHLALLLILQIRDLDKLLVQYRQLTQLRRLAPDGDIPF